MHCHTGFKDKLNGIMANVIVSTKHNNRPYTHTHTRTYSKQTQKNPNCAGAMANSTKQTNEEKNETEMFNYTNEKCCVCASHCIAAPHNIGPAKTMANGNHSRTSHRTFNENNSKETSF